MPLLDDDDDEEEEETFTVTLSAPADADPPLRAALTDAAATARGTIDDDDDPAVTAAFGAATYAAVEGGAAAAVTVRLSADPERTLVLPLTVAHHGGASPDDYAGLPPGRTVRFAAGVREAAFTITATDDPLDDDGESLALGFGELPDGVTAGTVPAATVTLTDDDATPAVTGATAFAVAEGATAVTELTATDADLGAGTLAWSPAAGGADNAHFTLTAAGVLAFTGAKDYENPDDADDDRVYELTVQVSDGANAATADLTVTLTDVVPVVSIAPAAAAVVEGAPAQFTVTRADDLSGPLAATLAVTADGAVLAATESAGARTVAFGDGAASVLRGVATADDDLDEADGAITATLQAEAGAGYRLGTPAAATVTVGDNDPLPALSIADAAGAEADAPLAFAVSLTNAAAPALGSGRPVTVAWATTDGSAAAGADYTAVADGTLTFTAGQTRATIEVSLLGDALDEGEETFTVTLSAPRTPGTLLHAALQDASATGTIRDDDTRGVTVSETSLEIDEGDSATYTVVLTSQPTATVTVGVGTSSDSDPDVTASPATLTFTTGSWNTPQTVTVGGGQDADAENDAATIEHTVSGGDYQDNGVTAADVAVTVDDDETAARELTLVLTVAHQDADDSGDVTLGDELNYTATATNSGNLTLSDVAVRDLLVSTGGNGCATLALGAACELTVSYTVTQADVDAGQVVNTATATATDVTAVTRSLTTEVAQQRALTLALSADVASFAAVGDTITYAYTVTNSGTVTLSGTVTITDDTVSGVTCADVPSSGLAPGVTASCSGTYATRQADVDAGGVASSATAGLGGTTSAAATLRVPWAAAQGGEDPVLTIGGVNGGEDVGQFEFAVSLSPASLQTVTVAYATAAGTATEDADYTGASGTLTFAPSATSRTITVTVQDDELDEEDESFTVVLSAPSDAATPLNATFAGGAETLSATATIADDDATPAITSGAFEVAEGQTVVGQLAATDDDHAAAELAWSIPAGSAGGADAAHFTLSTAGALAFAAAKDHENPDDANTDGMYAVTVQVSDGANAATADLTVTLTDVAPAVSIAPVAASVEEGTAAAFTLTRSGDLSGTQAVTVDVTQTGAVLATGQAGARQVTFADGATAAALSVATDDDTVAEAAGTVTATVQTGTGYTVGASATAHVTVTDNDAAALTLTVQPSELAESDTATAVTVTAAWDAGTRAEATAVTVSVGGGSATSGTDYTAVESFTLTIAATESTGTGTFTLTPKQDSVSEGDETIDVTGTAGDFTVTKAEMTLTDDETAPGTIALTTDPTSVREDDSATAVRVTATLGGNVTLPGATEVTVSVAGGSATSGTDYTAVESFTLTIAATESSGTGTFTLTPKQDSVSEGSETIDVTGSAGDLTVTKAEMMLTDDETAPTAITLTTAPASVREDDSATAVTVTATLDGNVTLAGATAVTVSVGGGSATSGTDYTAVEDFTLTIAATESTGTGTFTLTPTQDNVSEGDETIDVTGSAGDITVTKAEMTLTDDETAPTAIALTTAPTSVGEDDSATQVTVTATLGGSVTLAGATEVAVSVGGGTATSGTDYTAVADITLTIAATESSGTGTFTLTPKQDSVSEGDETIDVTGTANDFTVTKAEMTLTDDETAPGTIALTTAPTSVGEDDSATQVTVTATLDGSVTLPGATAVTVSVGGGSATSGTDYTAVESFTLTIAATESTGTGTFTLTPTQDSVSEGDETIDVTGAANDFTVTKATMTLTDDETAPGTMTLTTDPTSVGEDDSATQVTVTATLGGNVTLPGATEVTVSVGGGSATSGTDYTAVESFTLTIAATESTGTGTFTLTPKQDSVSEGSETIDVTGSAGDLTVTKAEMMLTDDETAPTAITLTTAPASVREDDSATAVTVTATLDGNVTLAGATAVTVSVGGGSATSGTDYTAVADFTLTIAATESTGTGTFTLTPTQDNVSEGDETIDVTGSAGDITVTKAEMTLTDDETAPTAIALTTAPTSVGEDDSATQVTVTATLGGSVTLAGATEVAVSVGGGSATSGTDYTAVTDFTLTIAATESTGTGTFTLTPKQDSVSEGDETIDVTGSAGDITVTKAEMTLTDDETAPTAIALTTAPTSVGEDDSATQVTVTATLGGNVTLPGATEVTVSVGGGSATSGTDYTAVESFTLTIAATESTGTGTFTLTPKQDSVSEGDETIDVTGTANDFTVTKAEMTLTDDETAPGTIALTTAPTSVGEDDSATQVTVTATLGGNVTLPGATEVTVSVGGGTAASGTDYTAVESFTLTIAATESTGTGTFTLTPTQDSVSEGDETIDVTGTAGDITVTKAEMTLTDDETAPGTIALTTAPTSVGEDDSATQVTVTATLGGSATLTGATEVTVSVGGGTAASGTDYTAVESFTLTIAATESTGTGTFTLTPTQDNVSEGDETIDVTGSAGDITVTKAEMTLTDDETAPTAIALTTAPTSVGEDDSATQVTVTATLGGNVTLPGATEVAVSVGGGSATSGTDYTAVADITLTIAATESSGTGTFTLTPKQDSVSEGDETIDITGTANDFTVTKAEMTLTDDETAPGTIALTTAPTSVGEDDSAIQVTVTATLGGSVTLSSATEVAVSVGGGSATSGTDYTAVADFTLTIAATESTGTGTFMLAPTQDSVSEGDETIDVTGTANEFTVTKAEMTLTDDETAPGTIALTTAPTSVREDDSATQVTVTATLGGSVTLAGATEVTVSVGGGTAASGTDYTAVADITLTIAATESSGTGTFTLTPKQDSVSEGRRDDRRDRRRQRLHRHQGDDDADRR